MSGLHQFASFRVSPRLLAFAAVALMPGIAPAALPAPDETPGQPGEWGFRPSGGDTVPVTPPAFAWRPQEGAVGYQLQVARSTGFEQPVYETEVQGYTVHCPPTVLPQGDYLWRFRYGDGNEWSAWSSARAFSIAEDAQPMPLPARPDLLARVPDSHPRLFVRPEWMPKLRERAQGDLKANYERLIAKCEGILKDPPPTAEPLTYPEGMERGSDGWRALWWGNREYTIAALNSAATLAFAHLLNGNEEYAALARRILMDCAKWDTRGATGLAYNDEAAMPYNYYFARTYTFLYQELSEEERQICRDILTARGRDMYEHLYPSHLWKPYGSHNNRLWHFLGEVGIALHGEVPEADDWTWFAANVFMNVYPVWSDSDGGWHEGVTYWSGYQDRFTWWADVMRAALNIDAFEKPYYSKVGYYPMYLQPPGTNIGGFGDLTPRYKSERNAGLMAVMAAQAQNPYWQWYVEALGGAEPDDGYIGYVRGALPAVEAKAPTDLPTSRLFAGIGQAMMNSTLLDARDNVEVIFKSSPFGNQSHGYESQNAFLLYVGGERVFIRTGRRDFYGSPHHAQWMWQTKSVNSITVNGVGQLYHSAAAQGKITDFETTSHFDWVVGEAAGAYPAGTVNRFTRRILYLKPEVVLIHDILEAPADSTYEWLLHAPVEFQIAGQRDIRVVNGDVACEVAFLYPEGLQVSQTDQFDPPPLPRANQPNEYHLTATTAGKARKQEFITILRPYKTANPPEGDTGIQATPSGFEVTVPTRDGQLAITLEGEALHAELRSPEGEVLAEFQRGRKSN